MDFQNFENVQSWDGGNDLLLKDICLILDERKVSNGEVNIDGKGLNFGRGKDEEKQKDLIRSSQVTYKSG